MTYAFLKHLTSCWLGFLALLPVCLQAPSSAQVPEVIQRTTFGKTIQAEQPFPQDPLQSLSVPKDFKGTLVYNTSANRKDRPPPTGDFVTFRSFPTASGNDIKGRTTYYELKTIPADYPMGVEFLADNKHLMLRLGWPYDRGGYFSLYLLDLSNLQQPKFRLIPQHEPFTIQYDDVKISPSGRYVAFVSEVDRLGNPYSDKPGELPQLRVLNIATGESHIVIENSDPTAGGWAWTAQDSLLFAPAPDTQLPATPAQSKKTKASVTNANPRRPAIYEVSGGGGTPKLLVRDAWRPMPSPNGKWIAFFGSENPQKNESMGALWRYNPQGASLCVVRRDGSGRKALYREQLSYPTLLWRQDNQHIIITKIQHANPQSAASIREIDISNGASRALVGVSSQDPQALPRPLNVLPPFIPYKLTSNGRYLLTKVETFGEQDPKTKLYDRHSQLIAVDLESGKVIELARFINVWGYDWYDGSTATPYLKSPGKSQSRK